MRQSNNFQLQKCNRRSCDIRRDMSDKSALINIGGALVKPLNSSLDNFKRKETVYFFLAAAARSATVNLYPQCCG